MATRKDESPPPYLLLKSFLACIALMGLYLAVFYSSEFLQRRPALTMGIAYMVTIVVGVLINSALARTRPRNF